MHSADVHMLSGRRRSALLLMCALLAAPLSAQTNFNAAFDASQGNIRIPHEAALDVAPRVTLEVWVKPSPPDRTFGAVIDLDHPWGFGFGLTAINGRTDSVDATVILAGSAITGPRIASNDTVWTHCAVSIDTLLHQLIFYINGVATAPLTDARVRFPNITQDLRIGRSTLGEAYRGMCDEVRVWNVVRTAPEISSLWDHEAKGNEPGLVAVYHFEDVRDTMAWNRAAGGGLHGILTGSGLIVAEPRPDAFIDEQESNGRYAAATPVGYGSYLKNAAIAPADSDCFKLWTRAGDTFRIQSAARNAGEAADLMISIYSVDSITHITSYLSGYPGFWSSASVTGYRFIRVINRGTADAAYTLNITRRNEVFVADEYEPNQTPLQAVARPWGVTSYGTIFPGCDAGVAPRDSDYYAYTAKAGEIGVFIYSLQGVSTGSGYARLSDGSADLTSTFPGGSLNHRFLTDGTCFLKIVPNEAAYRYYFGGFKVLADIHDMLYDMVTTGAGATLWSGTGTAYYSAYALRINGSLFEGTPDYASTEADGRQMVFGPVTLSGLTVTRKFFVPTATQGDTLGYLRVQDVYTNATAAPITVTARVSGRLGGSPLKIIGSSSGDTLFTVADTWLWTDDAYPASGRPNLVHIMDGIGGSDRVDSVSFAGGDLSWEWRDITVQPGETKVYLYYHTQDATPEVAATKGPAFSVASSLPAAAKLGLGGDGGHVMNWPTDLLVGVEDERPVPRVYALEQNYPNPFNPVTVLRYQLAEAGHVRLVAYDLLGREVAVLVDEARMAGDHVARFDGSGCASGVYFCRIQVRGLDPAGGTMRPSDAAHGRDVKDGAVNFVATKAMMLVR